MDEDKDIIKILDKYNSMLNTDNLSDENIEEALNVLSKDLENLAGENIDDFKNDQVINLNIKNNFSLDQIKFNDDSSITLYNGEDFDVDVNRYDTVTINTGYTIDLPKNTTLLLKTISKDDLTPNNYIIDNKNRLYITLFNSKNYDFIIKSSEPICKMYLIPILSKEYLKID